MKQLSKKKHKLFKLRNFMIQMGCLKNRRCVISFEYVKLSKNCQPILKISDLRNSCYIEQNSCSLQNLLRQVSTVSWFLP